MISARTVLLLALVLACASSFGIPAAKVASKAAANSGVSFMKSASIAAPVALVASPAFAMMELPTQTLSLEVQVSQRNETKRQRLVDSSTLHMTRPHENSNRARRIATQFGAYLAVLLGTFLPVLFLINLYIQTESRKAGKAGGQDSE